MKAVLDDVNGTVCLLLAFGTFIVDVPLMIFLVSNSKQDGDVVTTVMISLTVSDLVASTSVNSLTAVSAWIKPVEIPYPLLLLQGSLWHVCTYVSIWNLAIMSTLKCYIIVRPLTYSTVLTSRRRDILIAAVWIVVLITIVGANISGVGWVSDPTMSVSVVRGQDGRRLRYFELVAMVIVPGCTALACYTKILFIVRQQHIGILNSITNQAPAGNSGSIQSLMTSVRSARSLFVICFAYYICYIPAQFNGIGIALPIWYVVGSRWLLFSSSFVNGLLYILLYRSTRRKFLRQFCPFVDIGDGNATSVINSE